MKTLVFACAFAFSLAMNARAETTGVLAQLDELIQMAQGKRIGMITNPSGCDEVGNLDSDYVANASGTTISAFFAPEHGLRGTDQAGQGGGDYIDPITSIPVWAVYGVRNAPTDEQMATVDILVFDMQDVGVRFYTFVWTMTHCMESAARNGKPFVVIDRPNPIDGLVVAGAPNPQDYGLVGRKPTTASLGVATRHGMTAGEVATYWNAEAMNPKVALAVIKAKDWTRDKWWTDTGRLFVPPSPNMRTPEAATVYPGTCIFEGSNLSVGRGTAKPFEWIGAPFINGADWVTSMTALNLPGVNFTPIDFTPTANRFTGQLCHGVQVNVTNRDTFDPIVTGLHMMKTVYHMYPGNVTITSYAATLMGVPNLNNTIKTTAVDTIVQGWQANLQQFLPIRANYLLYGASGVADWQKGEKPRK